MCELNDLARHGYTAQQIKELNDDAYKRGQQFDSFKPEDRSASSSLVKDAPKPI